MDSTPEDTAADSKPAVPPSHRLRLALKLVFLMVLLTGLHYGGSWAVVAIEAQFMPWYQAYGQWATAIVIGIYILLLSIPFMPGIEVGLAILMIFGVRGVLLVYLSTLAALLLSYGLGRMLPARLMARVLGWLHLERARALVVRMEPLSAEDTLALLLEQAPLRIVPFLLRHRYLAVAAAFNIPGNFVIGGGGGIALLAGLSGLFRFPAYLLMVALAISPVPLFLLARAWWG